MCDVPISVHRREHLTSARDASGVHLDHVAKVAPGRTLHCKLTIFYFSIYNYSILRGNSFQTMQKPVSV